MSKNELEDFFRESHEQKKDESFKLYDGDDFIPKKELFPLDIYPDWAREMIEEIGDTVGISRDFPALAFLGMISGLVAGKVSAMVNANWKEPLVLWVLPSMDSGERKGPVFSRLLPPLEDMNRRLLATGIQLKTEALVHLDKLKDERKEIKSKAFSKRTTAQSKRLKELEVEITNYKIPSPISLLTNDATPEMIVQKMFENGGRCVVVDTEGNQIMNCLGRYSGGKAALESFIKGFSQEAIFRDRVGSGSKKVEEPNLVILSSPQPDVIRRMCKEESNEKVGFIPRFIFGFPNSKIGQRKFQKRSIDPVIEETYYEICQKISERVPSGRDVIQLDEEALDRFAEISNAVEIERARGNELYRIKSWMNKYESFLLRISGIMHILHNSHIEWWCVPIRKESIERAHKFLSEYAIPNALSAYQLMGASSLNKYDKMEKIVSWMIDKNKLTNDIILVQEIFTSQRRHFENIKDFYGIIEDIQSAGHIEIEYTKRQKPHKITLLQKPEEML